ncbi:patatin-like phospholipase family protein [Pelomonas sp. SE-A7]|uniref:patatin-like phospholipase family protein n=1 Tax=Pelomonas sp. SE-A7 TaxID=3054953 RepID=UPI00259CF5F3|nr:patatin-like phospholipase family protein [Pelomonas sp. SE-A7]MDM4766260.1 patatin-like phospholipase family protein [Pelomonas sp. SE-A7]
MKTASPRRARVALALAGGGPLGAIYEIGALCALEEVLSGFEFKDCDGFIGVSAGGFIAAGLANGLSPRQLCAAFIENSSEAPDRFDPALLLRPAWDEYRRRLKRLPGLLAKALWEVGVEGRSLLGALERLGPALPTGLLSGEPIAEQLRAQFSLPGRTDDFRQLRSRLVLVATDLDSGAAVPFGMPGHDEVPISRAVQASAALPGLFPPVRIAGRYYVDGALKKTLHASVLLAQKPELLICLNPLVPYQADEGEQIPPLVDAGLPVVMSQTFRSLIHSRLELGMKGYARSHPDTDILLFEPDPRDAELYMANTFSYSQRRRLAEHAYQQTRAILRRQFAGLKPRLAAHGLKLDEAVLFDADRQLLAPVRPESSLEQRSRAAIKRLDAALSRLEARHA